MDPFSPIGPRSEGRRLYVFLLAALCPYAAVFLYYAVTRAFTWDESYHLLAAQLIDKGLRPYIDFCYPQSPLNVYWMAGWMRLLGQNWRVPHAIAALLTIGAVVMTADYVFRKFPVSKWRLAAAATAGLLMGLNVMTFVYGPVGQAYGMCLFMTVASFRLAVKAVDSSSPALAGAVGLLSAIAAASSLLSAAATPVLLGWMLYYNRAGRRWPKGLAFLVGAAIPWTPVALLFAQGPRQTWFNLVQYHAFFRRLYWPETTRHDIETLTSWIDSGQSLILGGLALAGLYWVVRRSGWSRELKAELYLCAWLAAGISLELGRAHPTFVRYFLLITPFLGILAAAGLYAVSLRDRAPDRPHWPALLAIAVTALGLARGVYDRREWNDWSSYEKQARKIDQVTPRNAPLFADEPIYFLMNRTPPHGLELYYSHKVNLPPADRALLHLLTEDEVKKQAQSGRFATAYSCNDDLIDDYGLKNLYRQSAEMDDCSIFWDWKK